MKIVFYINKFEYSGKFFKIIQNCYFFFIKNVLKKFNIKYYIYILKIEFYLLYLINYEIYMEIIFINDYSVFCFF